ncbi:unnamed protein product [Paramecium sonneborni]|uniref:Uncharacterized protein n=1 Tax=Paramecium sonneborni TaxID=65129 RepID=A0A8S1NF15_9CILI|nr:unnamed protein product [Paramecium sonneborni]
MKNDICSQLLTLISIYYLFLDLNLLRLNLFIGLLIQIIEKIKTIIQYLPYFRIMILDIFCFHYHYV